MKKVASDRQKKIMLQKINVMSMLICQDNRSAPIPARTGKKLANFTNLKLKQNHKAGCEKESKS